MSIAAAPILHERQQNDSNLCAQHALNSLIQESLFSADQLADIGKRLDQLEADQLDPGTSSRASHNVDDSGFFSVGVLEEALKVHGLRLVRWDSEELRPMHNYPEAMPAFIFNLSEHWFTIRRFAENGDLFFNLNSFLPKPERVSKLYLGMQIQQAQQEGYSVFAVVPEDMDGGLPVSPADTYFYQHPHLAFAGHAPVASGSGSNTAYASSSSAKPRPRPADFDDDMDVEPVAQRRRLSDDEDEVVQATNGMRQTALDDEEEQMRRAIEASLADVKQKPTPPSQPAPQWKSKEPPAPPKPAAPAGNTLTSSSTAKAAPVINQADEDDSPSPEELRRRRLARFG